MRTPKGVLEGSESVKNQMKRDELLFICGMIAVLLIPGLIEMLPNHIIERIASAMLAAFFVVFAIAVIGAVFQTINGITRSRREP